MDSAEQALFSDVVVLVNRSKHPLEFTYGGQPQVFGPGEKKSMPRHIAEHGIGRCPILAEENGVIIESFFGIEGNKTYTCEPTDIDPEEIRHLEKTEGADKVILGGEIIKKKLLDLKSKILK